MQDPSNKRVHDTLLFRYVSDVVYADHVDDVTRHKRIRKIPTAFLPTSTLWEHLFSLESAREQGTSKAVLSTVYEHWQAIDLIPAVVTWAGWLADHGDGKEAVGIMSRASARLSSEERVQLDRSWNSRLDGTRNGEKDERGSENEEEDLVCAEPMPMILTIE